MGLGDFVVIYVMAKLAILTIAIVKVELKLRRIKRECNVKG